MALKAVITSEAFSELPAGEQSLYKQEGESYVLDIEGVEEHPGAKSLKNALEGERDKRRKAVQRADEADKKAKILGELDEEGFLEMKDELEDLRQKRDAGELGKGEEMDKKVQEIVTSRLERETRPLQRKIDELTGKLGETEGAVKERDQKIHKLVVDDAVSKAADKLSVVPTAKRDIIRAARDIFTIGEDGHLVATIDGVPDDSLSPEKWLEGQREDAAHWFPSSGGGGAGGNDRGGSVGAGVKRLAEVSSPDDITAIAEGKAVRAS